MSEAETIRKYCKAHPGQYFTYEELIKATGVCVQNVRSNISQIKREAGFNVKTRRVLHEGRTVGEFKYFKNQSRLAWVGEQDASN